jgi:ParB-like chromosome segregation protein Spo0J
MQIEQVSTESLIPYARNSRTHSEAQVAQIAASIKEFGFTNPVLIDEDGGIIAGHGRTMAARKLGLTEVPCIRLSYLTDAQKKAYVIADNKLALNAGWDDEMLKIELQELADLDFNLELTGFDLQELAKIFDEEQEQELEGQSYSEVFNIIVECSSEQEQEKIFNRLDSEGYKCRVQSL